MVELWISVNGTASPKNRPTYETHPDAIIFSYIDASGSYKQYNASNVMPANVKDYYVVDENGKTLCVLEDMADYWVIEETSDDIDNTVTIVNYFQRDAITGTFTVPATLQAVKNGSTVSVTVVSIGKAVFVGTDFGGNAVSFGSTIRKLYTNVFRLNDTLGGNINLNSIDSQTNLTKSSGSRSGSTPRASSTSFRIWSNNSESSPKVSELGSLPLSVRNFRSTGKRRRQVKKASLFTTEKKIFENDVIKKVLFPKHIKTS